MHLVIDVIINTRDDNCTTTIIKQWKYGKSVERQWLNNETNKVTSKEIVYLFIYI